MSVSCYANFTNNLRWSIDASARLNSNRALENTSRIYVLGLDSHKVFTSDLGDVGYGVGQIYFTQLSNQIPVPWMFESKDDSKFVFREFHLNYTALPRWLPNIRVGHFTLPFGLEENIDTNGRLLDYYHGQNLGTKLDWGLGLNKVLNNFEYNISYTLGGKDKAKSIDNSYAVTGRVGTLSHLNLVMGISLFNAEIDMVKRKRFAFDWQYYWGTWGLLGEFAFGEDNEQQGNWQKEKYVLLEVNKSLVSEQLKFYSQYIFKDKEFARNILELVNFGFSYQFNTQLEISMSARKQLNSPVVGEKKNLVRFQIRYRY